MSASLPALVIHFSVTAILTDMRCNFKAVLLFHFFDYLYTMCVSMYVRMLTCHSMYSEVNKTTCRGEFFPSTMQGQVTRQVPVPTKPYQQLQF